MRPRIAAIQYKLRQIEDWSGFEKQVNFVLNAAADYQPQFVLLPEIFTTQMLSFMENDDLHGAVRSLSSYTERYSELLRSHAMRHNYFLIGGVIRICVMADCTIRLFYSRPAERFTRKTKFIAPAGKRKNGRRIMAMVSGCSILPAAK